MAQSTVKLIVDAHNAIRPLQRVNEQTKNLTKNTDKLKNKINNSNKALKGTGKAAKTASGGVNTLVASLRPLLAALAIAGTARFVFVKTADLQTQRTALTQLTGSIEEANKVIANLQAFGNLTPFTSSELIEQSKRLKAFGFETENLVDTVKRLSDVAGATGADLSGIATAFGQIRAKGKLQQEENLQLLERGVDITSELKRITGLQGDEFESAMRKGQIGAGLVNEALINLTDEGGVFFGGATKQSETLNGQISTLQDNIEALARVIGEELEPALLRVLEITNQTLGGILRLLTLDFQRQISGFRLNLEIPGDTISDLEKIEQFTQNIQPLGLDVSGIDLRISQLEGTSEQIKKIGTGIFTKNKEINQTVATQEAIRLKIEALLERKKVLLGDINKKTNGIKAANEKTNQVLEKGTNTVTNTNNKLKDQKDIVTNTTTEAEKLKAAFKRVGDSIATNIRDSLVEAVKGTKTLGEMATSILNDIADSFLRIGITQALKATPFGGFFSGLGFADGGRPPVGKASVVGERGPELFVPSVGGKIISNDQIGRGGATVNVTVNATESNVSASGGEAKQLGLAIASAVQQQLVKERRPGGLLS